MEPLYTYQIIPVQLTSPLPVSTGPEEQGKYLVFWWKSFALGHLFLEAGVTLTRKEFLQKVKEAIGPAVDFYSNYRQATKWRTMLALHQQEAWISWMETVFTQYQPEEVPAQVPVSVVVCTCNRAMQLQQCLNRLSSLPCRPMEIIVVDNAPKDEATKMVVEKFAGVQYVREPRVGLDVARNTGAHRAGLPIVAYVDDDVTVHPLWMYQVWQTFQDPDVAAMTGLVMAAALTSEAQCIFEKHWSFNRGYVEVTYGPQFFQSTLSKGPPVWKIGAGANMAFRKEVFAQVGYFHELLDAGAAGCNGDSEMWYRLLANGHTIRYNPKAIVFHEHRQELEALKKQIFNYMRGHTVAALLQRSQYRSGYIQYLLKLFFIVYPRTVLRGFPDYSFQYSTLWSQITGMVSGWAYYMKHKQKRVTVK